MVKAVLGLTKATERAVAYDPNGPTVYFTCAGVTLDYECTMDHPTGAEA